MTPIRSADASARSTSWLAGLFPGYFALVMATGIVAIAAAQQEIHWLADGLFGAALISYVVLAVLFVARLVRHRNAFVGDLTSHLKGPSFLTLVAGTNVLGSAAVVVGEWWWLGWTLWVVGIALWMVLVYTIFAALMLREPKPAVAQGINGTWFLFTVATQSVAVLGALLSMRVAAPEILLFVCACAFFLGLFLYMVVATLVVYRFVFVELRVEETHPPYWISLGAAAISVLAGSNLLLVPGSSAIVKQLDPFLSGMVVLAWATATFWIPVMIVLGAWRHGVRRVPVRYDPQYWSLVFPLGMYSVATFRMAAAVDIDFLDGLPKVMLGVALIAWTLAFVGLLRLLLAVAWRTTRAS
ncbi:MAG: tellurite resistance/C4-dicarboxylate transporter family protein [Acidimicrobiia bacterium]